ncbi:hypothetical protein QUA71_11670, partial [Microcoleus sp. MON1_C5]
MTVKKMSVNVAKVSKKSRLPVSSLLPRIAIYSAVMAGIIAGLFHSKQVFEDVKIKASKTLSLSHV